MPAWPGGPCPDCGDEMPPRVLRCRTCGALLNTELQPGVIEAPEFVLLPEVSPVTDITANGYFIGCPNCEKELRIASKYQGATVQCKICTAPFKFELTNPAIRRIAVYADCPHCKKELRVAVKYLGKKVGCKHCEAAIRVAEPGRETV
jgi:transcription elongation factor Elf1